MNFARHEFQIRRDTALIFYIYIPCGNTLLLSKIIIEHLNLILLLKLVCTLLNYCVLETSTAVIVSPAKHSDT